MAKNWMPAPAYKGGNIFKTWVPLLLAAAKLSKPVLCNILFYFMMPPDLDS
jgi:hypothetical protein